MEKKHTNLIYTTTKARIVQRLIVVFIHVGNNNKNKNNNNNKNGDLNRKYSV